MKDGTLKHTQKINFFCDYWYSFFRVILLPLTSTTAAISEQKIYDRWEDFDLFIINLPFLCSCIPASSTIYGVYVSQLLRYVRASSVYFDFLRRQRCLKDKLKLRLLRCLKIFPIFISYWKIFSFWQTDYRWWISISPTIFFIVFTCILLLFHLELDATSTQSSRPLKLVARIYIMFIVLSSV